ncbi:mRNA 3'-end-processing protein YTH1, partial [Lachnellula arida]
PTTMTAVLSQGPGPKDLSRQILEHQAPQYTFTFTPFLFQTYRHGLSPDRPTCKAYLQGHCPLGSACPDKHPSTNNQSNFSNMVCKHWLRALCKKGESCEFLHEYNLRKMPECNFFVRNGYCSNGDECLYLHIDPSSKLPPCPHYEKGFCPLGPNCSKKHVRKTLCEFYLAGFCPDGKHCRKAHPRWPTDLPKPTIKIERDPEEVAEEQRLLRENAEREHEREYEKSGGGEGGGRGRGRWHGGGGYGRGRGQGDQRRQRGRGHY